MARLARYTQLLFGSSASNDEMAQYGSFAAGTPATYSGSAITPALVQALSNYLGGWFSAVIGVNAPTIQDLNSVCYLFSYQLAQIFQSGVTEWDSATTYYIGNLAQDGAGNVFKSITNTNLSNALTDNTNWLSVSTNSVLSKTANYNVSTADSLIQVSITHTETLPDATLCTGREITFVKTDSNSSTITFATTSSQTISGIASGTYTLTEQWSFTQLRSNGSNWLIVGAG